MGAGGIPNRSVEVVYADRLEARGKPNSKVKRFNRQGKHVQDRWYDNKGLAERNRDYSDRQGVHDHNWDWSSGEGIRGAEHLPPDYINYK